MAKITFIPTTNEKADFKKKSSSCSAPLPQDRHSTIERLLKATETLHNFSTASKKRMSESGLRRSISLIKQLISKAIGKCEVQKSDEVLQAVEIIQSHRIAIASFDDETYRNIAKAVEAYNSCREESYTSAPLPKIALHKKHRPIECHFPAQRFYKVTTSQIKTNKVQPVISQQTSELFHMKVISLLERYGIANPEARQTVKKTPIQFSFNPENHICTLTQTIQLFPKQTITVCGASEIDPVTQTIKHFIINSVLFGENFVPTGT